MSLKTKTQKSAGSFSPLTHDPYPTVFVQPRLRFPYSIIYTFSQKWPNDYTPRLRFPFSIIYMISAMFKRKEAKPRYSTPQDTTEQYFKEETHKAQANFAKAKKMRPYKQLRRASDKRKETKISMKQRLTIFFKIYILPIDWKYLIAVLIIPTAFILVIHYFSTGQEIEIAVPPNPFPSKYENW